MIGPATSGKSTFIENTPALAKLKLIDIWDYQGWWCVTLKDVLKSYVKHRRAALKYIEGNPDTDLVVEHTLLRAVRRKYYVPKFNKTHNVVCWYTSPDIVTGYGSAIYEPPTLDEGFTKIHEIERNS